MEIRASFSTRSRTVWQCAWPFSTCAEGSRREPSVPHRAAGSVRDPDEAMSATAIRNGRIIDPANDRDEVADLLVLDGRIVDRSEFRSQQLGIEEIDAAGLIVAPGLIDIHVHLREPGFSWKETIASGAC